MALLTTLFSALSRKLGDLLRVVFGWSTATLFGRLTAKKQTLISVALILSLFWPIFVVGTFVPAAATFVIAFIPIKDMLAEDVLRVVWIGLAIATPLLVGVLIRLAVPDPNRSAIKAVLNGYPLAFGFFASFVITLVTVPVVKVISMSRRWSDQHLYVQPRPNRYLEAMKNLCEACVMAGLEPHAMPVPKPMALSTRVMQFFARGSVDSLVVSNPLMVRTEGLQMFLYPADLLIRGEPRLVAKVKAMLGRTHLEKEAYLVESETGQRMQDELGHLWESINNRPPAGQPSVGIRSRLKELSTDLAKVDVPYDEWALLDRIARRVEYSALNVHSFFEEGLEASHTEAQAQAGTALVKQESRVMTPSTRSNTAQLVEVALHEMKTLVNTEIALAKEELRQEVSKGTQAAIGFGTCVALAITMVSMLALAAVLAAGGSPLAALIAAGVCLVLAAAAAGIGYSRLPLNPLERTRRQLSNNVKHLKEHLA